ncbi:MAG: hypothetical protein IKV75_04375 [Bacteroidales bacterium]|nr:hypothetical protein [Bacteroidales bacterium]
MGNFVDGEFISDQGLSFNIVEKTCSDVTDTLTRAMISCDVLSRSEDGGYNIRLTGVDEIFTKNPVDSTSVASDTEIMTENPLSIEEIWYAGGYLNMLIYIPVKENSKQAHLINLVRNDVNTQDGTYRFTFKHNAFGELITASDSDFLLASAYVSFPIAQLFQKDEKKVQIVLNWTSNEEKEGVWSDEMKKNTITLEVERIGYEHKL